ncbi:hypothetical protein Trydic_g9281 [Trypoxylus dichotomus]
MVAASQEVTYKVRIYHEKLSLHNSDNLYSQKSYVKLALLTILPEERVPGKEWVDKRDGGKGYVEHGSIMNSSSALRFISRQSKDTIITGNKVKTVHRPLAAIRVIAGSSASRVVPPMMRKRHFRQGGQTILNRTADKIGKQRQGGRGNFESGKPVASVVGGGGAGG